MSTELSMKDLLLNLLAGKDDPEIFVHIGRKRLRTVECIICGRNGPGYAGTASEIIQMQTYRNHWQLRCCKHPHIWECACGKFFPDTHSLGSHVGQCRRHGIDGHGRMDRVGWYA